jgi:hypothetical protein
MKNLLLTIAVCAFITPAAAQAEEHELTALCPVIGTLAESIMRNRQDGIAMSAALNASPLPLAQTMVTMAYGETRWHTASSKARAVQDFRDFWELSCYTNLTEGDGA